MRVLHLAAGNRWTGAAAPAFAETAALREAGVDAHYAYVGGYKLQQTLAHVDFAHPVIAKRQNPVSFLRTAAAIENLVKRHGFDVIHAHLTWDHVLALYVARRARGIRVVRTFHSRRVIRGDVLTRAMIRRTDALCVINSTLAVRGRDVTFTPPPLDTVQFTPEGADVRARYGIAEDALLLVAIGKLDPARGFEDVLRTFALVRREKPAARLMIIGHGPHRPALEAMGIDVLWAGYHEDDLAEHYRAADVLLFTAKGSDEGHRAVIEAMGCGVVPAAYPIDGIDAIAGDLPVIASSPTPEDLAARVLAIVDGDLAAARRDAFARSSEFSYARAAERLIGVY
jgi:glycosyltransferase involved in cell wall biosynthesis